MSARTGFVRKNPPGPIWGHPRPFFPWAKKCQKKCIFLGGPMGPIHLVWGNRPYSPSLEGVSRWSLIRRASRGWGLSRYRRALRYRGTTRNPTLDFVIITTPMGCKGGGSKVPDGLQRGVKIYGERCPSSAKSICYFSVRH